MQTLADLSWET